MIYIVPCFIIVTFVQVYAKQLNATITVYNPRGIRISIPDDTGIEAFYFWANINEEFGASTSRGKIKLGSIVPFEEEWLIEDDELQLKSGDVINYVMFIKRHGVFERYDNRRFLVPGSVQQVDEPKSPLPSSLTTVAHPKIKVNQATSVTSLSTIPRIPTGGSVIISTLKPTPPGMTTSKQKSDVSENSFIPDSIFVTSTTYRPSNATNRSIPASSITATTSKSSSATTTVTFVSNATSEMLSKTFDAKLSDATTIATTVSRSNTATSLNISSLPMHLHTTPLDILNSSYTSKTTKSIIPNASSLVLVAGKTGSALSATTPGEQTTAKINEAISVENIGTQVTKDLTRSTRVDESASINQAKPSQKSTSSVLSTIISPTAFATSTQRRDPATTSLPKAPVSEKAPSFWSINDCIHTMNINIDNLDIDVYGNTDTYKINPKMLASVIINGCSVEYKTAEIQEPDVVEFYIS